MKYSLCDFLLGWIVGALAALIVLLCIEAVCAPQPAPQPRTVFVPYATPNGFGMATITDFAGVHSEADLAELQRTIMQGCGQSNLVLLSLPQVIE